MVTEDTKHFWDYILHKELNLLKFIKSSELYQYASAAILLLIVMNKNTSIKIKSFVIFIYFILIFVFRLMSIHKSGIYKAWHKEQTGIPTKAQLRELKEKARAKNREIRENQEESKAPPKEKIND